MDGGATLELVKVRQELDPLLVSAEVAGPMCGRSESSWWRDCAEKRVPRPVRLGARVLWRVEELRRWVAAGCPTRADWEKAESWDEFASQLSENVKPAQEPQEAVS